MSVTVLQAVICIFLKTSASDKETARSFLLTFLPTMYAQKINKFTAISVVIPIFDTHPFCTTTSLIQINFSEEISIMSTVTVVEGSRNILHEIRKRKANWIGHILRTNCLLQRVTEGKIKGGIEVTGRRGRRRRKLLDDMKERRGYSHLKEEALDRTMWRAGFGRGFGPVVRQTAK
jgi:hypothetical protein